MIWNCVAVIGKTGIKRGCSTLFDYIADSMPLGLLAPRPSFAFLPEFFQLRCNKENLQQVLHCIHWRRAVELQLHRAPPLMPTPTNNRTITGQFTSAALHRIQHLCTRNPAIKSHQKYKTRRFPKPRPDNGRRVAACIPFESNQ
jgi:hypothetical protein